MQFTKMHGCGNDYIYVNTFAEPVADAGQVARLIADRHTGVGSDGLILVGPAKDADVRMEMYNADGSRGRLCGNGLRCVGKFALDKRLATGQGLLSAAKRADLPAALAGTEPTGLDAPLRELLLRSLECMAVTAGEQIELRGLTVATDAGRKQLCCWVVDGAVRWVTADMGVASLRLADMSCTLRGETAVDRDVEIGGRGYRLTCVAVGSLHAVIFVADPAAVNLAEEGPAIERAAIFPERVNVHFVHCRSREILAMRTWERGSGATLACGTGSCAAVVAGVATGRTERKCAVHQPGGMVLVSADEDLLLSGPVETVCTGTWHAPPATVPD